MKRVLITGASGFVGANLAFRLLDEGHEVHALLRSGFSRWRLQAVLDRVRTHQVDLSDTERLGAIVGEIRPDWVFHLAAYGGSSHQTDVDAMVSTNLVGTVKLLEACVKAGIEAFVHTGSSSEYGFKRHAPAETEMLEPNSPYAVTKAAATLFCRYTAQRYGLNLCTLRLYSVYGPWEDPARLMPQLIMKCLQGKLPQLATPSIARDYVHVDDVADACLLAASRPARETGAIYNVGTGVQTDLRTLVQMAREVLGVKAQPEWGTMPDRQWDSDVWVADSQKIRVQLGWKPKYQLQEGFQTTVRWYQDRG